MELAAERGTTIHGAVQIWCETGDKALALAYAKDYAHWVASHKLQDVGYLETFSK